MRWDDLSNHEKNELVAIEFFGWYKDEHGLLTDPTVQQPNRPGYYIVSIPPSYTEDIREAWTIAEKMAQGWVDFSIGADPDREGYWIVVWGFDGHGWDTVTAKTAPEAICLAALLSKGIKI